MMVPVTLADQDASRLEDDGAPMWPAPTDRQGQPRLAWAEPASGGSFDGAWWPRSRNAPTELEAVLALIGDHLGVVVNRVSLNMSDWNADQPRRMRLGQSLIRLGWFRTLDAATATFGHGSGDRATILVVPPDLDSTSGRELMQQLAAAQHWPTASAALAGATPSDRAEART
jgi:Family of unknown function (DUF5994)